jgi:uncharacterized protein YqgC (DUF456 family)
MMLGVVIALGVVLHLAGLAGGILPMLPGPPLNLLALALLALATRFAPPLSLTLLLVMAGLTLVVSAVDYVLPVLGARQYGATAWGIWGSAIGLLIGLIWFPPLGLLIGAFIGALAGELIAGKKQWDAFRAGFGVCVGTLLGVALKLGVSGVMVYYYVRALVML